MRAGFLYPGHAAEDDYPRMAGLVAPPVEAHVVHTSVGVDAHRVDDLLDLGGPERLAEGSAALAAAACDVAVWACTSGSFVFGPEGAREQVAGVEAHAGVPASSTSFAFVNALAHLGIDRVAIAATYPADVAHAFEAFLAAHDVKMTSVGAEDVLTATEVGTFGRERVVRFVTGGDHPDAEAVLVPDTALHSAAWIDELEAAVGKPVLTANQVTMWEALRLAGVAGRAEQLGTLFRPAR
jgi:maleate cis-trans isomerase